MTVGTNARIAGAAILVYIGAGMASLALARNAPALAVLAVVTSFAAVVLGVTLYAITRRQDADLAMLGLACRIIEAVPGHGEIYAAVGFAICCGLFLRGRMIPVGLAWFGLMASILFAMLLFVQAAGFVGGPRNWSSPVTWALSLPLLVFQLALALYLLACGVSARTGEESA